MITYGRAALAIVGLRRAIDPAPFTVSAAETRQAESLADEVRTRIDALLAGRGPASGREPFDFAATIDLLVREPSADDMAERVTALRSDEAGFAFGAAVTQSLDFLRTVAPRRARQTYVGARVAEPDLVERSAFRLVWSAVDRPLSVFDDLAAGLASSLQIDALAAVWPDVLEMAQTAAQTALAERGGDGTGWEPTYRLGRALGVLFRGTLVPSGAIDAIRGTFEAEKAEARASQAAPKSAAGLETPIQRVAAA